MKAHFSIALLLFTVAAAPSCAGPREPPEGRAALPVAPGDAHAEHRFCGWLNGADDDPARTEQAYETFTAHAAEFDAVHPTWWRVDSPTSFANHADGASTPFAGFHDARVLARTTPGGGPTRLVPMIGASVTPDYLHVHHMINDPDLRRQHVQALVDLVTQNPYDGLDLDYEHLDPDHLKDDLGPGRTGATERDAFSAFVTEAARALHAVGKTLSVAVPVVIDFAEPVFDYDVISREVDVVHLMTYDYHYEGDTHAGPVAPLGWIEEQLERIRGIDGGRRAGKFLLGLANYGLIGPEVGPGGYGIARACVPTSRCLELFHGGYDETTAHMSHCSTVAMHPYAAGRAPNVALAGGERLFFEDLASQDERIDAAVRSGLGGVTYWSIGGEPGGDAFFAMVRSRYPRSGP